MEVKVKLADIVERMDIHSYDNIDLLHIKTGKVVNVLREFLTDAENGKSQDGLPDWHQEQLELAYED